MSFEQELPYTPDRSLGRATGMEGRWGGRAEGVGGGGRDGGGLVCLRVPFHVTALVLWSSLANFGVQGVVLRTWKC